jgi:hypothetical protein
MPPPKRGGKLERIEGIFHLNPHKSKILTCSAEKIKEQVMGSFDDASSRRLFNWGSGSSALPYYIMAGWLLKKGVDWPKRLARTLAPPKNANKYADEEIPP